MDLFRLRKRVCEELVRIGRELLLPAFSQRNEVETKPDGSWVTAVDRHCEARLQERLAKLVPDASFLGEESAAKAEPMRGLWWCVDPLDGTGNFVAGFPFFAVSVALFDGATPILACVHDPWRGETFSATEGSVLLCNEAPLPAPAQAPSSPSEAIGFCDFKRLAPHQAQALLAPHAMRSQRNLGACALEWAWLAAGRAHFLIHGGQAIWDYGAGAMLAARAGVVISDFSGRPLHPKMGKAPVVAARTPELHASLLQRLESARP